VYIDNSEAEFRKLGKLAWSILDVHNVPSSQPQVSQPLHRPFISAPSQPAHTNISAGVLWEKHI